MVKTPKEFVFEIEDHYKKKYEDNSFEKTSIVDFIKDFNSEKLTQLLRRITLEVPKKYKHLPELKDYIDALENCPASDDEVNKINSDYEYYLNKRIKQAREKTEDYYNSLPPEKKKKTDDEIEAIVNKGKKILDSDKREEKVKKFDELNIF